MFSYVLIGSGNWQQVPGGLTHVSVGSHFVWGVNVHNSIYRCALPCSGGWVHVAGGLREIDVGETEVWGVNSHDDIYVRPADGSGNWKHIGGKLRHVSVGREAIWGVNSAHNIYRCNLPCTGGWINVPGALMEVDVAHDVPILKEPEVPPAVTIGNPASKVTSREFDFHISVSHPRCFTKDDCFGSDESRLKNKEQGLTCEVFVAKVGQACHYSSSQDFIPCLKGDDFYDSRKFQNLRKHLSVFTGTKKIIPGNYQIHHNCFWKDDNGNKVEGTQSGWKVLHNFEVIEGCADWLPEKIDGHSTIAHLLLL